MSPMDPDWLDDDAYQANLRAAGPLETVRRAAEIAGFEADDGPPARLRLRYATAGTAAGPNAPLAEVVVIEGLDVVSVSLLERVTWGVRPDGWEKGEKLAKVHRFVEVLLMSALGDRRVIDGSTGAAIPRLELSDPNPRTRYGEAGCPRWVP